MKKKLVISAINFTEGGPLTVLRECLASALDTLGEEWEVVALVHDRALIDLPAVRLIEFPRGKSSWFKRLYYEWFGFRRLSRELDAHLWLSLHDITPIVSCRRQSVYCHNPAPFYKLTLREALLEPTLLVFNQLYGWVYRFNIQRNRNVVVQQVWLREQFQRRYNAPGVVVAHPVGRAAQAPTALAAPAPPIVFLYPALPRVFKNLEVILEAVRALNARGVTGFEVQLTIDGSENRYAAALLSEYAGMAHVAFVGRQGSAAMAARFRNAHCLLFPSRLETWGLPISEGKALAMPMFVADLPYAHETVGVYDQVRFFSPDSAATLSGLMESFISGDCGFTPVHPAMPADPYASDWPALLKILVDGL